MTILQSIYLVGGFLSLGLNAGLLSAYGREDTEWGMPDLAFIFFLMWLFSWAGVIIAIIWAFKISKENK